MIDTRILLPGVPVKGSRGYLGWSNVVLINVQANAFLCDTGSYGDRALLQEKLRRTLAERTKIKAVILSHFHFDHVQNLDLFPEAKVIMSRREWEYVSTGEYRERGDTFVPAPLFTYLKSIAKNKVVLVDDGEEITPGVSCKMLPGHTPGSLGLWLEEKKTLILGDAVKNGREYIEQNPTYHFDSKENWLKSRKLAEQASRIIPGHDVPYILKKGEIIGYQCAPQINLEYTPFNEGLNTLRIDKETAPPLSLKKRRHPQDMGLLAIDGKNPRIEEGAYVDPRATLVGEVIIENGAGIWPGAVIRGDEAPVIIKEGAMILENAVVEASKGRTVIIGPQTIVSHGAIVHGAQTGSRSVIGIGAIVLDDALVGDDSIIGAGALVSPAKKIKQATLFLGMPAKEVRPLNETDFAQKTREWRMLSDKLARFITARGL